MQELNKFSLFRSIYYEEALDSLWGVSFVFLQIHKISFQIFHSAYSNTVSLCDMELQS